MGRMRCSPTITIFGVSVVSELKERRDSNQRKKAKPKIVSLVHLRDKEEHLQAKNGGDLF